MVTTAKITQLFYPDSITDDFDTTVNDISKTSFKKKVKHGKNVLFGKNVKIGQNCLIGANSLITEGMEIPDNSLVMGSPAKVKKELDPSMKDILIGSATHYVENYIRFKIDLMEQKI